MKKSTSILAIANHFVDVIHETGLILKPSTIRDNMEEVLIQHAFKQNSKFLTALLFHLA